MTVAASKALRVLLLTDENLIPDKPRRKLKGRDAELSKTEYDVLAALKKLGHEVTCAGVGSDLSVIRRAILRNKPHVVFNLVEQFDGLPFFDQHVVSYLELRAQKYTGCNPRGLTLARDKALTKKILAYHRLPVARFAVFKPRKKIVVSSRLKFPMFVKSLTDEGLGGYRAGLLGARPRQAHRAHCLHPREDQSRTTALGRRTSCIAASSSCSDASAALKAKACADDQRWVHQQKLPRITKVAARSLGRA